MSISVDSLEANLRKAADGLRGSTGPGARDEAVSRLEHITVDAEHAGLPAIASHVRRVADGLQGSTGPGQRDVALSELENILATLARIRRN